MRVDPKLGDVAYWRSRLDEVGESATRTEFAQLGPLQIRSNVQSALEVAINQFREHESVARVERGENRAEQSVRHGHLNLWIAGGAVALSVLALVMSAAAYRLAFGDDEHDRRWRAEQRFDAERQRLLLEQIRDRLPPPPVEP